MAPPPLERTMGYLSATAHILAVEHQARASGAALAEYIVALHQELTALWREALTATTDLVDAEHCSGNYHVDECRRARELLATYP